MSGAPAPLTVIPVLGIAEVDTGTDLPAVIVHAAMMQASPLADGDCVVVTQKVVSKAEGRVVELDPDDGEARRRLVESEAVRVLRRRGDLLITETAHGLICANAGVDLSNVPAGRASLLPVDPDRSARRLRDAWRARFALDLTVVISDTFGRPWRRGLTDVAIGVAGITPVLDLRSSVDTHGRDLQVTELAVVDEIAGAAELVMGKATNVPAAIVRGLDPAWRGEGSARDLVRPATEDLFR